MSSYELGTLKKGLQILDLLRDKYSLTMNQVMEELSLNKTSAYKLLYTLEKMKYIIKFGKYYHLNPSILTDEKTKSLKGIQWTSLITPYHLARSMGETVYMGILDHYELVIKNVIKSPFNQPCFKSRDKRTPVHSSALGKAILANLPTQQQREVLNCLSLENLTENSFIDKDLFLAHLNIIKIQGYALDNEETNMGKRCIAAPIYFNDAIIGSLAIHGEVENIKKNSIRSLSKKVIQSSRNLTKELEEYK